ncbi:Pyrimidine-specific ribonucleoside hydrolase RihB [Rubripirellula tenax]|uniref:Pyrimidine-specific ribonucleoside hydrolase RihB n=1 Tax=Rubripirellula tenax TaxID=2528015 RepID=A0A5C6FD95_9BACT|nr:nucleoside hydrolase [Rubripirellula tenax]TWU58627.1 Pyrimidine-specific ribonucleoside hydrolase RihB [Rubripirellula tenax]
MSRKIIIDCDPGIDDAIAIAIALFDPRLDVLAITSTAGTVEADQATRNVTAIVHHLDPARYPRIGMATAITGAPVLDDSHLNGSNGLGDFLFDSPGRQNPTASEKIIGDLVHQNPNEITLVCLGPLTNLARLCRRDPMAIPLINNVVISGGSVGYPGNATPVAERNIFFDPISASEIFSSATTKSLVPLDVTEEVLFGVDLLEDLPSKFTRAGMLLHKLLPFAFRTAHQKLGRELIPLYDATTLLSVVEPDLFQWEAMAGRVETRGELTCGQTVFDQRLRPEWPMNMEVAIEVDSEEVQAAIKRLMRYAGQQT